jgi:RHH-type transcriptional regulator, rel operon repressor / antitoxin RelB
MFNVILLRRARLGLGSRVRTFRRRVLYSYSEVLMLAIRLPRSIEKRLEKLARRTGRTKTFYVREAILEHLDDLEDLYLAERRLDRIRSGDERTIPLEDALKRHGLED